MPTIKPLVISDSREQAPWTFTDAVDVVRRGLPVADYSLDGMTERVGLERKSINDCVGSLTQGRERFFRELDKLKRYEFARLIVECTPEDILEHRYQSMARPASILGSLMAIDVDLRIGVVFAGDREHAQLIAEKMLIRAWNAERDRLATASAPRADAQDEWEPL